MRLRIPPATQEEIDALQRVVDAVWPAPSTDATETIEKIRVSSWPYRPTQPQRRVVRCDQCSALPGECTDDYGNNIGSCYKPTQNPRYEE